MRFMLTILVATALSVFILVSGCGLISGLGDDSGGSSSSDTAADSSAGDTSFLSDSNNAFLSGAGSATTTEASAYNNQDLSKCSKCF